ncbi:MAG: putative metal-binding motif-containing protein, partial [Myxococcota bacterium]|nr:putative metal-binding motif-containing protein [Myxococcota bacterium]
ADCDGAPDDDADGDGFDAATAGGDDCDDTDHMVHPYGFELPDGSDNDCDGLTDESAGTSLSLSDDDYDGVSFGFSFPFCGSTHSTVYIGSNGILFFTSPSGDYTETETEFLGTHGQSIAAFWDDLDPRSAGTVYYQDYGDAFGVFYEELPEYATSNSNTFSTVFFDDGTILQSWDGMASVDGMVGWSCGTGVAGAVDLSAEVDALEPHELYVGSGSEDSLYELFYSGSPLDLDGEMVWYTGAL